MVSNTGGSASVGLLRGINVGGHRKIPMKDLRELVEAAGCENVSTYIQSGNVIFTSKKSSAELRVDLEHRINATFGFPVEVMVRSTVELTTIIHANPFVAEVSDPTKVFVVFLHDAVTPANLAAFDAAKYAPEQFIAKGREIYLHLPEGAGRAKLNLAALERGLNTSGTARNWKTITTLLDLAQACGTA